MKNITVSELLMETIGVSNLLSRKQIGVEFSESGDACTDGKKIVVPDIPPAKKLTRKAASIFRGLVDHESAHVRYTDFSSLKDIETKPKYIKLLLNYFEDYRIDNLISQEYSGSTLNIDELYEDSLEKLHHSIINEVNSESMLNDPIFQGMLYLQMLGFEYRGIKSNKINELKSMVPQPISSKLDKFKTDIPKMKTTYDALNIAKNAAHLIGFKPDKSSEMEQLINEIINFFEQFLLEALAKKMIKKEGEESAIECEQELNKCEKEPNYGDDYKILSTSKDIYRKSGKSVYNFEPLLNQYSSLLLPMQNLLKTELERLKEVSDNGKKLDPKSLVQAFQCKEKVFQKKSTDRDIDTAILFAVDASGSMNTTKTDTAFKSAYLLCRCLDSMNVKTKVTSFSTQGNWHYGDYDHEIINSGTRFDPLLNLVHKDWHESTFERREYFWPETQCQNADGESLLIFGQDLLNQPEQKKIMIVLSDGWPSATGSYGADDRYLQHALSILEQNQIILGSIGIESAAPDDFYKFNEIIYNLNELPKALTKLCSKLIIGEKNMFKDK